MIQPKIILYTSRNGNNIEKILIFSQKKAFLIFPDMEPCPFQPKLEKLKKSTPRQFLIFQEMETQKKNLYFLKKRLFLYLRKRKPRIPCEAKILHRDITVFNVPEINF